MQNACILVLFANQLPQGDKTWEGENETRHHRLS